MNNQEFTNLAKLKGREERYKKFSIFHRYRCKHMIMYPIEIISAFGVNYAQEEKSPRARWVSYDGLTEKLKKKYEEMVDVGTIYKCSDDCLDNEKMIEKMRNATI